MSHEDEQCAYCGKPPIYDNTGKKRPGCPHSNVEGTCSKCQKRRPLDGTRCCWTCRKNRNSVSVSQTPNGANSVDLLQGNQAAVQRPIDLLSKQVEQLFLYAQSSEKTLRSLEESLGTLDEEFFSLLSKDRPKVPKLARGLASLLYDAQMQEDGSATLWKRVWRSIPYGVQTEVSRVIGRLNECQTELMNRLGQLDEAVTAINKKLAAGSGAGGLGGFLRRDNPLPAMEAPLDWTKLAEAFASNNYQVVQRLPELFNKVSNTLQQQRNAKSPDANLIRVLEDIDGIFVVWQQRHGIERFPDKEGEKFNPNFHRLDGSMVAPDDPSLSRTVKSISEYGYRLRSADGPNVTLQKALVVVWD